MALKHRLKFEDLIVGTFVVLALFYPLLITFFIYSQKEGQTEEIYVLRTAYIFLAGFEGCPPEAAARIGGYMDTQLLKEMGGIDGLIELCNRNRLSFLEGTLIEERIEYKDSSVTLKAKMKGKGKELRFEITGSKDINGFKITRLNYAEGS
ncbi:hypothetical protein BCF55_0921 [Hydrogenivirga caldilitoris]|uniref:Uncharacterized protein n=1 Tax=Hydrogenivirga caldilitoris TaxID=246264 RepID=A0A497XUT1_9AQUI|nr:hypothetical protein [Hydrogenivirga caldilitoris]RLJ70643.1 hypothetical protein BCF55_0921 [Hydrogenivirga caldilitoris]